MYFDNASSYIIISLFRLESGNKLISFCTTNIKILNCHLRIVGDWSKEKWETWGNENHLKLYWKSCHASSGSSHFVLKVTNLFALTFFFQSHDTKWVVKMYFWISEGDRFLKLYTWSQESVPETGYSVPGTGFYHFRFNAGKRVRFF